MVWKPIGSGHVPVGSLAVVFPLIERMNVVQIINQHLPPIHKPSSTTDHLEPPHGRPVV